MGAAGGGEGGEELIPAAVSRAAPLVAAEPHGALRGRGRGFVANHCAELLRRHPSLDELFTRRVHNVQFDNLLRLPEGRALWGELCDTLGLLEESPLGEVTMAATSDQVLTPLHWHAPPVLNLHLGYAAESSKLYLFVPFEVARRCGMLHSAEGDEARHPRMLKPHEMPLESRRQCRWAIIGCRDEHRSNAVFFPRKMLHHVRTSGSWRPAPR